MNHPTQKIIIACDKFKGTLSSSEANVIIEKAILSILPDCETIKFSVSDGGEGFTEAMISSSGGQFQTVEVCDPLMRPVIVRYGILEEKTVVVELASAEGLSLLKKEEYNPLITTTYGVGQIIEEALNQGYRDFILGIGGSATNDAGTGLLQALGYKFLDENGRKLGQGGQILEKICGIDASQVNPLLKQAHFLIACDVDNPFSGEKGAASVFAPQKGANSEMVDQLDRGMENFASVVREQFGIDIRNMPSAGAAGGVGGAMNAFLNAKLDSGIDIVLNHLQFDKSLENADFIFTGEGKMDAQTCSGKVIAGIVKRAKKQSIPVVAFAGLIEDATDFSKIGIQTAFSINPPNFPEEEALKPEIARKNLYQTVVRHCESLLEAIQKEK